MDNNFKGNELEERLVDYSVEILKLTDQLENAPSENHFRQQLIRSGTSTALIYGEARGAESK